MANNRRTRSKPTKAKAVSKTRRSQLEIEMLWNIRFVGLPAPEEEHRFAPPRRWKFDFAWPKFMVALEIEGGTFQGGRHNRAEGFEKDCEKYNAAAIDGWLLIRATSKMVKDGRALIALEAALKRRMPSDARVRTAPA